MIASVSNIAWSHADELGAFKLTASHGIRHLEIAPTKFWPDLAQVSENSAREMAELLRGVSLQVCAFQALMFGKPQLQLFAEDDGAAFEKHLSHLCCMAGWMGAAALVLGSPKNRLRGDLDTKKANEKARPLFQRLGDVALSHGVTLCIEPNPAVYGGDYLLTCEEVAALVTEVDSPGIRLNLDMGELALNDANVSEVLHQFLPLVGHFHVSEPMLAPLESGRESHRIASEVLRAHRYQGFVSLEMKAHAGGLEVLGPAMHQMLQIYFPPVS